MARSSNEQNAALNDLILDELRIGMQLEFSREELECLTPECWAGLMEKEGTNIAVQIIRIAYGQNKQTVRIQWPATWWEHVKDRWFPLWLKRKFPVQFEIREIDTWAKVCPHIRVASEQIHFQWFLDDEEA